MTFEACFYKADGRDVVWLNVRKTSVHSVSAYHFSDLISLRDKLWNADLSPEIADEICGEIKKGRRVDILPALQRQIMTLIETEPFDSSRPLPRDISSFD